MRRPESAPANEKTRKCCTNQKVLHQTDFTRFSRCLHTCTDPFGKTTVYTTLRLDAVRAPQKEEGAPHHNPVERTAEDPPSACSSEK